MLIVAMRPWASALAAILLMVLAGCGRSTSTNREVVTVVNRWQAAVASRHVSEACSLMSAAGKAMLSRWLINEIPLVTG